MSESTEINAWRNNWFVKNTLAELPIVGAFFQTAKPSEMLHHAGKHMLMLAGGSTLMMYTMMNQKEDDSQVAATAIMVTSMGLGMAGGAIVFNSLFSAVKKARQVCRQQTSEGEQPWQQLQELPSTSP